MIKALFCAQEK
uniref:Uncharacterized protein n=1 Tax=Anguilla anguilla TaxID=7936 RepID=A0A0E9TWC0_ANGAN